MSDFQAVIGRIKARLASYLGRGRRRPQATDAGTPPTIAAEAGGPKISVIVPIYGTEAHVERCLRSVMDQTLREIEIICVDDASPDNSAAIVARLAAQDDRIRLIRHDRNIGAGAARNSGIEAARAPYVTGVDSDDYILPGMLETLWEATEDQTVDVVACGMGLEQIEEGRVRSVSPPEGRYSTASDDIDILDLLTPSFCARLWRRTLFTAHGIRFPESLYYEDLATTPRLLGHANSIRTLPRPFYRYALRGGSRTDQTGPRHIVDHFRVYDILGDFLHDEGLWDRYRTAFTAKIGATLHYHTRNVMAADRPEAGKRQYLRQMLMLKLGYLDYNEDLRRLDAETLQALIGEAASRQDLDRLLPARAPAEAAARTAGETEA